MSRIAPIFAPDLPSSATATASESHTATPYCSSGLENIAPGQGRTEHTENLDLAHQDAIEHPPRLTGLDSLGLAAAPESAPAFDLLRNHIVGNGHRAERHAPMTRPGSKGKYYTVHQPITDDQIQAHLTGASTFAIPLIGSDGLVGAALVELDTDHLEGARRVQRAAAARNVVIVSIAIHGAGTHDGSHNWALFAERVTPAAARKLMQDIAADAGYPDAETWPNDENIRLPGGVHRWTNDWGIALLPTGELFDLGSADEHMAFFAAWQALPLNETPAEPPKVERKPSKINNINLETKLIISTRSGPSPIEQFNATHEITDLLSSYGGHETRDGAWSCNCGYEHSHENNLAVTSQGKLVAYSPNCRWAPHKDSGKAQDAFGLYCLVEHDGNVQKAVAALLPPGRGSNTTSTNVEKRTTDPAIIEARRKDAQRKREARRQAAADLRADVEARAAADPDLTPCDHAVLDALLTIAGDRGWARPSKERLAEMTGYSVGSIKRALASPKEDGTGGRLEGRYFTSEGEGGGPNCTAVRTFLRGSCFDTQNTFVVKYDPRIDISSRDLYDPPVTCEPPPGGSEPETLDEWEWQADAHGAEELNALDQADANTGPERNSDPPATCEILTSQPADRMALVARLEAMTDEELRAWGAGLVVKTTTSEPAEPEPETVSDLPGASYVGEPLIVEKTTHNLPSWLRPVGDIGPMERKVEESNANTVLPLLDLPEPEVRCPPSDPVKASRYYALRAKAKRATSPGQRIALDRIADGMMEWRPPSAAPTSQAPPAPAFRLPPASPRQVALFAGGD